MNDLEQRLQSAAEETRQLARTRVVAPLGVRQETRRHGLAIFASAFAVVIILFGVLPWLLGDPQTPPVGDMTPSTSVETTTTLDMTTTLETIETTCSATGISMPSTPSGVPEPVAATSAAIATAASSCDLEALENLATDTFTTSFGGGGVENLARWEERGEGRLGTLLQLLDMSHGTVDSGETTIYVWPAAFIYDSWEEIPDELLAELSEIYTQEELDLISGFGSYAGWRTSIDEDGNWLSFVEGD
jgi:hypothetical protein